MKKNIIILILTLILLYCQLSILNAQTWKELMDSTDFYFMRQDYQTALGWAKSALSQAEKEFGKNDTNYTSNLLTIATLQSLNKFNDSAQFYTERALEINRKIFKDDHIILANNIFLLAKINKEKRNFNESEQLFREALEMRKRLFKGDNPDIALCINELASIYMRKGNYTEAELLFKEALEMYKKLYTEDNIDLVMAIGNLGDLYYTLGKYKEAESFFKEGLQIARRLFKSDHPFLAKSIGNMAAMYQNQGKYADAEAMSKEALEMKKKLYSGDDESVANAYYNLGALYSEMGRYPDAETMIKESLEMLKRMYGNENPYVVLTLKNLGNICFRQSRYLEAELILKDAVEISRRINKIEQADLVGCLLQLGYLYTEMDRFSQAEPLFKEALELEKTMNISSNSKLLTIYNNLGYLYNQQGRYAEAESLYKEALEMSKRIYNENHPSINTCIGNLGMLYKDLGRYSEAEILLKESLEGIRKIHKEDHTSLAIRINNLALLYDSQGKNKEAELLYKEALDMARRLYKSDHHYLALSISNLGSSYLRHKRYEEAEPLLKESLDMRRRLYKGDHSSVGISLNNLAYLYGELGRYNEEEAMYKDAFEMFKRIYGDEHPTTAVGASNLACSYMDQNKLSEAEPLFIYTFKQTINQTYRYFPHLSEKAKLDFWKTKIPMVSGFQYFGVKYYPSKPEITGNMYDVTLATKGLVLNSTKQVLEQTRHTTRLFENWKSTRELWLNLVQNPAKAKKIGLSIDSVEKSANEMEKEISQNSFGFKKVFDTTEYRWQDVQRRLGAGECAVEIIKFKNKKSKDLIKDTLKYAALIVKKNSIYPEIAVFENGNELDSNYLNKYRKLIDSQRKKNINHAKLEIELGELYNKYWAWIETKLKDVNKVYFSPDGVYNLINLNTLRNPESGKYVIEEKEIINLTNTRELVESERYKIQSKNIKNAVLFGNPKFKLDDKNVKKEKSFESSSSFLSRVLKDITLRGIEQLPGTSIEVNKISSYLRDNNWQSNSLLGPEAMELSLKSLKDMKIIHIATHGLFLKDLETLTEMPDIESKTYIDNPLLRSMLLFSGAENTIDNPDDAESENDGFLNAYEAMNLNLDNTDLVVLSACETGLGEVKNGEGVYGLQRAFLQAGAKSLIMSLWSVSDEATQELMTSFYDKWLSGKTKREAFREAQVELKNKYHDPYFWGAFVMVGE